MKIFNQHHPFVILDWEMFKQLLKRMTRNAILTWLVNDAGVINADDYRMLNRYQGDEDFYEALFTELEESLK